ncbi:MAG: phosphoribosylformylglycinamidine synthase subunit PurS [Bacteroidota bacterium]|nr:phosphoribosylformylglycinamidine synthase subunit PurS [Bacteroidota bacterium]
MKKYRASIDIMPHKELLDPQGKTILKNLPHMEIIGVTDVRIGKHIVMDLDVEDEHSARELVEISCKKLLTNIITESYTFSLKEIS